MNSNKPYFIFLAFRNFIPMSSFMVPYMIESKGFAKKEVMDSITHCVFIFSILTAFLAMFVVEIIGKKTVCIVDAIIELMVCLIMIFMKSRSFFFGQLAGSLHGITKSLETVSKSVMYTEDNKSLSARYAEYSIVKHAAAIMSSLCGQEFYFVTHSHIISMYVSTLSLSLSIFCGLLFPRNSESRGVHSYELCKNILNKLWNSYDAPIFIFCLLNIISSTLLIGTSCYSTYIFIERRKGVDVASNRFGKIFYKLLTPMRWAIICMIRVIAIFDHSISIDTKYDKNVIIFGYMDALAKFLAILPRYYIIKKDFRDSMRALVLFALLFITMLLVYLQCRAKALLKTYLLSILCLITSVSCLGVSNNGFSRRVDAIHIFYCVNLFTSAAIHTIISYFSRRVMATAEKRLLYYCYVNILLMLLATCLCIKYIF